MLARFEIFPTGEVGRPNLFDGGVALRAASIDPRANRRKEGREKP
jgi:hypothetical protein